MGYRKIVYKMQQMRSVYNRESNGMEIPTNGDSAIEDGASTYVDSRGAQSSQSIFKRCLMAAIGA